MSNNKNKKVAVTYKTESLCDSTWKLTSMGKQHERFQNWDKNTIELSHSQFDLSNTDSKVIVFSQQENTKSRCFLS